jgi:two-component system, OmpR family, alkaline phosphatase synthesis response regulator PhoP
MRLVDQGGPLLFNRRLPVEEVFVFGDVRLDFTNMELVRNGFTVRLTATEFDILTLMVQNPERVISRPEFLDTIWSYRNELGRRAVDSHIRNLRQKLEGDPAKPIHLRTVRCVGYMFIP